MNKQRRLRDYYIIGGEGHRHGTAASTKGRRRPPCHGGRRRDGSDAADRRARCQWPCAPRRTPCAGRRPKSTQYLETARPESGRQQPDSIGAVLHGEDRTDCTRAMPISGAWRSRWRPGAAEGQPLGTMDRTGVDGDRACRALPPTHCGDMPPAFQQDWSSTGQGGQNSGANASSVPPLKITGQSGRIPSRAAARGTGGAVAHLGAEQIATNMPSTEEDRDAQVEHGDADVQFEEAQHALLVDSSLPSTNASRIFFVRRGRACDGRARRRSR